MEMPKKLIISEVGLRDGLQNEATILTPEQKLELLADIADAGFKNIEVGSFVRPDKMAQMADTDEVYRRLTQVEGVEYRALIPNMRGLNRAIDCGCKTVKIGVSASLTHSLRNYNRTPEEGIQILDSVINAAFEKGIKVIGTVQMAFGSPWDGITPIGTIKSLIENYHRLGIRRISMADTAGIATPTQVYELGSTIVHEYPDMQLSLHFHNTRGMGIANILAGALAGVEKFDASFAGLGGCPFVPGAAGNVSSEDVIHALDELNVETGIDIDKVIAIGKKVEQMVGHQGNSFVLRAGKSKDLLSACSR